MRKFYISPFTNETNEYIEIQKKILRQSSDAVQQLSIRKLFSKEIISLFDKQNTLVFHWVENRCFKKKGSQVSFDLKGWTEWLLFFLLVRLTRANTVYFIHNHAVHDSSERIKKLSSRIIQAFANACKTRVVHDPSATETYNAVYLPHPLYIQRVEPSNESTTRKQEGQQFVFGLIGAIRPYKNIDIVLKVWPKDAILVVRGAGPIDFVKYLIATTEDRKISNHVSIENKFLSKFEFSKLLSEIDALILPHKADSMLVSGAFFEAIGKTKYIIARRTPFMEWASKNCASIICFDNDQELPNIVRDISNNQYIQAPQQDTIDFANREFGWDRCIKNYAFLMPKEG